MDLLQYLCKHREGKGKKKKTAKPEYLYKFIEFTVKNLNQYNQ